MRRVLTLIAFAMLLVAGGCTTRSDKEKNKDYDKPRGSEKADTK